MFSNAPRANASPIYPLPTTQMMQDAKTKLYAQLHKGLSYSIPRIVSRKNLMS